MKSQYKYLIAIFVVLLISGAWWVVQLSPLSDGAKCATNAYLVSHFHYSKNRNEKIEIDEIPAELSPKLKTFLTKARNLPIDAGDWQVKSAFPSSPEVSDMFSLRSFKVSDDDTLYSISKYDGCIASIDLVTKKGEELVSVIQSNQIPSSAKAGSGQPVNSCQFSERTGQLFQYYRNGKYSDKAKYVSSIPREVSQLFKEFQKFNYRRENLYNAIGTPERQGSMLSWKISNENIGSVEALLDVQDNCERTLTVKWDDSQGEHKIVKDSFYKKH